MARKSLIANESYTHPFEENIQSNATLCRDTPQTWPVLCCSHTALDDQLLHTDLQQAKKRTGDNFVKVGHSCAAHFLMAATINHFYPPIISSSLVEWATAA